MPQKVDKLSQLIWPLLSKFQINWKILSIFCGLLRKLELYLNSTDTNCRSGFLRRLQKIDKISQLMWPLLSKFKSTGRFPSIFRGLLRKPELYLNCTDANCSSGFLRRPQKINKRSQLIWPLLGKFQINWKISSIFCGLLSKHELYLNSADANCMVPTEGYA